MKFITGLFAFVAHFTRWRGDLGSFPVEKSKALRIDNNMRMWYPYKGILWVLLDFCRKEIDIRQKNNVIFWEL